MRQRTGLTSQRVTPGMILTERGEWHTAPSSPVVVKRTLPAIKNHALGHRTFVLHDFVGGYRTTLAYGMPLIAEAQPQFGTHHGAQGGLTRPSSRSRRRLRRGLLFSPSGTRPAQNAPVEAGAGATSAGLSCGTGAAEATVVGK